MSNNSYHIFFQNLANPLKTQIIMALKDKSVSVTGLSKILKVEQSRLSHALMSLKSCNIVTLKQRGKQRVYSLNKKTIIPILKIIDKHKINYCSGCVK